jgi:outer membrane protein assembly factor BamB
MRQDSGDSEVVSVVPPQLTRGGATLYAAALTGKLRPFGAPRWAFQTTGARLSTPVVGEGVIFCGASDGCAYAVDAATGAQLWKTFISDALRVHMRSRIVTSFTIEKEENGDVE